MPDRLVEKISARLDLSAEETASLLTDFVNALHDEVETAGRAVVPGMGEFRTRGDATIFEPDASLVTSVNYRFSELEPITVATGDGEPARPTQTPETTPAIDPHPPEVDEGEPAETADAEANEAVADPEPVDAGDTREEEDEASHPTVQTSPGDEEGDRIPEERKPYVPPTLVQRDETPGDRTADLAPAVVAAGADEEQDDSVRDEYPTEEAAVDETSELEDELAEREEEPAEIEPADEPSIIAPPPARADDRRPAQSAGAGPERKRSSAPWMMLGILVIVVGAIGLFLFLSDRDVTNGSAERQEMSPAIADEAGSETQDDAGTNQDATDDEVDAPPASQPPPPSPVYGDAIDRNISRYTLIVASLPSQASAQDEAETWRSRGFRTAVFSEPTVAGTRYRVGIGQFETIEIADSIRSESDIASELPEGTWVYRYPASSNN